MEPLVALGIACNLMQVISFGQETARNCKRIYETGILDPSLADRAKHLRRLANDLKQRRPTSNAPAALSQQHEELARISDTCVAAALALSDEIEKITPSESAKGKRLESWTTGLKATWRRRRLECHEKNLFVAQSTLEMGLLAQICSTTEAIQVRQEETFSSLDNTLKSFIQAYPRGQNAMLQFLQQEVLSIRTSISDDLRATKDLVLAQISHASATSTCEKAREKVLRSLKYDTMNARQNAIGDSFPNTFRWIYDRVPGSGLCVEPTSATAVPPLDTPPPSSTTPVVGSPEPKQGWASFSRWLSGDGSSLYWVSGKPGSGKSTLMKYLVEQPETTRRLSRAFPDVIIISHFIWSAGSPMQKTIKGMLCSLLKQLFSESPEVLDELLLASSSMAKKEVHHDWSEKELRSTLNSALQKSKRKVCIFIDGLDEICPGDGVVKLLEALLCITSLENVHTCVASRPEPIFEDCLARYPHIHIQDLTHEDIERFSEDRLHSILNLYNYNSVPDGSLSGLLGTICCKAEGVWLWVCLALKSLEEGVKRSDDINTLTQRVDLLPLELDDLFADMWNRLGDSKSLYQSKARRMFSALLLWGSIAPSTGERSFTALRMTLTVEPGLVGDLLDARHTSGRGTLLDKSRQTLREIESCSAGLLQINGLRSFSFPYDSCPNSKHTPDGLRDFKDYRVSFVHKSARDFLLSPKGNRLVFGLDTNGKPMEPTSIINTSGLLAAYLYPSTCLNCPGGCWMQLFSSFTTFGDISRPAMRGVLDVTVRAFSHLRTSSSHPWSTPSFPTHPSQTYPDFLGALASSRDERNFARSLILCFLTSLSMMGPISPDYVAYISNMLYAPLAPRTWSCLNSRLLLSPLVLTHNSRAPAIPPLLYSDSGPLFYPNIVPAITAAAVLFAAKSSYNNCRSSPTQRQASDLDAFLHCGKGWRTTRDAVFLHLTSLGKYRYDVIPQDPDHHFPRDRGPDIILFMDSPTAAYMAWSIAQEPYHPCQKHLSTLRSCIRSWGVPLFAKMTNWTWDVDQNNRKLDAGRIVKLEPLDTQRSPNLSGLLQSGSHDPEALYAELSSLISSGQEASIRDVEDEFVRRGLSVHASDLENSWPKPFLDSNKPVEEYLKGKAIDDFVEAWFSLSVEDMERVHDDDDPMPLLSRIQDLETQDAVYMGPLPYEPLVSQVSELAEGYQHADVLVGAGQTPESTAGGDGQAVPDDTQDGGKTGRDTKSTGISSMVSYDGWIRNFALSLGLKELVLSLRYLSLFFWVAYAVYRMF